MSFLCRITTISLCLGLLAGLVPGCSEADRDAIRHYEVARLEPESPADENVEVRLLGGMIAHEGAAWFFKVMGPAAVLDPLIAPFSAFLKSVDFDEQHRPTWALPEGWKEVASTSQFRYKTIHFPGAVRGVELTVSELAVPAEVDEFMLSNLNRWRGQVALEPIDAGTMRSNVESLNCAAGEMLLVNLQGYSSPTGSGGPMGSPMPSASQASRKGKSSRLPFRFQTPEGWAVGGETSISVAAFQRTEGGRTVTMTVTPAGGDLLANYNRWRGQIQLPEAGLEELKRASRLLTVRDRQIIIVEMVNEDDNPPRAIQVAIVPAGQTWFFKLMGDASLAATEKPKFEALLNSLQFEE